MEEEEEARAVAALGGGREEEGSSGASSGLSSELSSWKRGVEGRLSEVLRLAAPLAPAVAQLQRENRRLRAEIQRLDGDLLRLLRLLGPGQGGQGGQGGPRASPRRSQSLDLEDWKPDAEDRVRRGGGSPEPEWGLSQVLHAEEDGQQQQQQQQHQAVAKESVPGLTPEAASPPRPPQPPNPAPEAHAPATAVALRMMPHHPVTAVTKVSETFSGETVGSPGVAPKVPGGQHANSPGEAAPKASRQADGGLPGPNAVKTWSATSVRTAGSVSSERFSSVTKSVSAVSYESASTTAPHLPSGGPPRSPSPPAVVHRQTERRRELVRSQTLPRTSSAQARKALFEKFEQDAGGKGKGGGRPKLKRSQSFGVASASSIKQILLDWCRSKTIGYKHIDLQNFSCSWNDGMAFCALVHSFFPEAFDYQALEPGKRKENFELAFTTAEKMAGCDRLIEVDDMLAMGRKPDPMCVFTYVQSLYNHLRRFE